MVVDVAMNTRDCKSRGKVYSAGGVGDISGCVWLVMEWR